ncbi:MAG TPA: hypothetical protein VGZ02_07280 [Candidatus Baltobacteraceae bacterium]|nr:hypothetical protein [Candidatus Baltobacteraceae bacterium]
MNKAFVMRDGRALARIIHLTHRFGCSYTRIEAHAEERGFFTTIDLAGPAEALRRLDAAVQTIIAYDKETT